MIPAVIALGPIFIAGRVVAWAIVIVLARVTLGWALRHDAALDASWTTDLLDQAVLWGLIAGKGYPVVVGLLGGNGFLPSLFTAPLSVSGGLAGVALAVLWQWVRHRPVPPTLAATTRIWLVVVAKLSSLGLAIEALQMATTALFWAVVAVAIAGLILLIVGWTRNWGLYPLAFGTSLVIGLTQLASAKAFPVPAFAWSAIHIVEALLAVAGWVAWGGWVRRRGLADFPDSHLASSR